MEYPKIPSTFPDPNGDYKAHAARCLATHPNHQCSYAFDGKPWFWTAWCSACDKSGHNEYHSGEPPKNMDPEYLRQCQAWAKEQPVTRAVKRRKSR